MAPPIVNASGVAAPAPAEFVAFADTIHGVVIPDPLRWLEDTVAANTRAWKQSQSAYTDSVLGRLVGRDSIAAGLERAYAAMPTLGDVVRTPSRTFLVRYLDDSPSLMALDSGQTAERELISATALDRLHPGARIRTFVPSWDGRLVALGITRHGDANAAIVIVDAAKGRVLPDGVPDLLTTTSGSRYQVTWLPDESGFFYPRLVAVRGGSPTERFARGRQFLHRIGDPQSADTPVFGFDVSPAVPMDKVDLPTRVGTSANSKWMFAAVFRAKLNGTDHYAAPLVENNAAPAWVQISAVDDRIGSLALRSDTVYAISRKDADRGQLVRMVLRAGASTPSPWEIVLPERKGVITGYVVQDDGIYLTERSAGAISLLRLAPGAKDAVKIRLPLTGSVTLARGQSGAGATVSAESWVSAPHWMVASGDSARSLGINDGYSAAPAANLITDFIEARSKDGTMVPVSVVYGKRALRNGHLDGSAPLLIDAYGGFGVSTDPTLNPLVQYLVSQGGIYAWAHVRGGGELGGTRLRHASASRTVSMT